VKISTGIIIFFLALLALVAEIVLYMFFGIGAAFSGNMSALSGFAFVFVFLMIMTAATGILAPICAIIESVTKKSNISYKILFALLGLILVGTLAAYVVGSKEASKKPEKVVTVQQQKQPEPVKGSTVKPVKSEDEFDVFRGVKWGTDIKTLKGFKYVIESSGIRYYRRTGDKLMLGSARLEYLDYGFWNGNFMNVLMQAKGANNWEALKEVCKEKFGEWSQPNMFKEEYMWEKAKINVYLRYDTYEEETTFSLFSKEIFGLYSKDKETKAKEKAKKGAEEGF